MTEKIHTEKPVELFKELVDGALEDRNLKASDDSSFYLVGLLESFVRPGGIYGDVGTRPQHPLGPLLLAASRLEGVERFNLLRSVGDLALFLTGFFYASLERRLVNADYYSWIGESAYGQAAETCRPRSSAALFEELAGEFVAFSLVLHQVSRRCAVGRRPDLLGLYQTYLEEQAEGPRDHARGMLQSHGILLYGPGNDEPC